ncbi:hypothetical protein OAK51_04290 [Alphaproteobacteria bacterium]|nr:hypothetical protein [Alphaproteobacteria bacterium]
MKNDDEYLQWKLCKDYFSIVTSTSKTKISLEELCAYSKVSYKNAAEIIPKNNFDFNYYFLKILVARIDLEALDQLKNDIADDTISTVYDKILEGITIRFEKYLPYKEALRLLSSSFNLKTKYFLKLFEANNSYMLNLLELVEERQICSFKIIKSITLNIIFARAMDMFLKEEKNELNSTLRYLDKYLSDVEDIGFMLGIIKNKL